MNTDLDENAIDIVGDKISELLRAHFSSHSGRISGILYPIAEVIDNVDDHSQCSYGALLVQHYPNKKCVDICIADDGISIPGSYEKYGIKFNDDVYAVRMALAESISTKPEAGHDRGYGLRTTAELICNGLNGETILASRDATLRRDRNREPLPTLSSHSWDGTIFAARLNLPSENFNLTNYIE